MGKRDIPILVYHSISRELGPSADTWTVSPEMFEAHVMYLHSCGYTALTVTEFVNARASGRASLPDQPVILTFDDGNADFYEHALPALRRHGFVATFYITTSWVGANGVGANGVGAMPGRHSRTEGPTIPTVTWSQLAEIAANGIECGGHSHTHPQLDAIPHDAAWDEIVTCKTILEDHLGRKIATFAYPHGWYTGALERMVRSAGFTSACAVKNMRSSTQDNVFELARLVVTHQTDVGALERLLARDVSWGEIKLRDVARHIVRGVPRSRARTAQWRRASTAG